jgi:heme/copper-type cytochrome/quinol oxidase subunit 2
LASLSWKRKDSVMNTFLIILLVLAVIATVVMLVRGAVAFLQNTEKALNDDGTGPSASSIKQNKMMMGRIQFQAIAVIIVILLLALTQK